jgi:hypothetical protein
MRPLGSKEFGCSLTRPKMTIKLMGEVVAVGLWDHHRHGREAKSHTHWPASSSVGNRPSGVS